jgi:hypothetical protein
LDTHIQLKITEDNSKPDGCDSSDDVSKTNATNKENSSIKTTNNLESSRNISEQNGNSIVNYAMENSEIDAIAPIKPSEPSDPSAGVQKKFLLI